MGTHYYSFSTIVFIALFGCCVGALLTHGFWRLILKRRINSVISDYLEPGPIMERLVQVVLLSAIKEKRELIILGEPDDSYQRHERQRKPISDDEQKEWDKLEAEVDAFNKKMGIKTEYPPPLPVWYCTETECYEGEALPAFLRLSVIDTLFLNIKDGIVMNCQEDSSGKRVKYSLSTHTNGSLLIRLAHVD